MATTAVVTGGTALEEQEEHSSQTDHVATSRTPESDEQRDSATEAVYVPPAGKPGWICPILLVVLTGALYWPTIGFDFVNWDDPWYVINNPLVQSWQPENLVTMATRPAVKNYAPVTMLSYLVDHTLWELDPGGFHFTNCLLHIVNAVLVYLLLFQLTRSRFVACAAAALFAIHPVQVESVAWISSRKGLLSGTFMLASLICWLREQRTPKSEGYGLLFFVLALLSKANAVVLPAIVLTYDVLVRRQTVSVAFARQIVPGFFALLLLLVTMSAQTTEIGGVRDHLQFDKGHILAIDSLIVWKYVGMLVHPVNLCVLYDPPTSGIAGLVAVAVAGWIAVAGFAIYCRKRWPLITFGFALFFILLLPVLNLFPISTLMNDRYLYLPSIPLFALVAAGVAQVCAWCQSTWGDLGLRRRGFRVVGANVRWGIASLLLLAVVTHFSRLTYQQLPHWKDGMALWQHADTLAGQLAVVQIQLANTLHASGQDREAIARLDAALANCDPDPLDRQRILRKLAEWKP